MDVIKIISELHSEREKLDHAIRCLERLQIRTGGADESEQLITEIKSIEKPDDHCEE